MRCSNQIAAVGLLSLGMKRSEIPTFKVPYAVPVVSAKPPNNVWTMTSLKRSRGYLAA